jgi:2'-5' RNA ligase
MPPVRAFIAIELPAEIRQKLNAVEQQIQARAGEDSRRAVRWVAAEKIHLTLKFLGDVSPEKLPELDSILKEEAARSPGFDMVIGGLGAFPNPRRPRVVWVGCEGGPALAALQKAVDRVTQHMGFPSEDRPFSAHLTLGRVNEHSNPEELAPLQGVLSELKIGELGRARVERFHLFRSDLRPGGPVYTSLYQFPLSSK